MKNFPTTIGERGEKPKNLTKKESIKYNLKFKGSGGLILKIMQFLLSITVAATHVHSHSQIVVYSLIYNYLMYILNKKNTFFAI